MDNMTAPVGGAFLIEALDAERMLVPEQLSSEARLMAKTMDDFVRKEVLPNQERLEAHDEDLLRELVKKSGELGLLAGTIPEAYDGLGLSKSDLTILSEKSAPNTSYAITIGVHTGIALLPLLYFGTEEQKRKYLPRMAAGEIIGAFCLSEAGSGSDALAASTKAVLSDDGASYRITGTKMWITNAAIADLFTVFAKIDGEQFTAFLIEKDTPGLSLGREEDKLGIRGSSTRRVILDDCVVPAENVLGEVGKGYRPALYSLNIGRFNIGASALGNAKYCLGIATEYAKQRSQFGQPIANFGAVRHKLAEMAVRLFVLESMVYRTAGYWDVLFAGIDYTAADAGEKLRAATEEYAVECALVKVFGTETLAFVTDEGLQIHGGFGFSEEYPMARQYRDARISRIYEGTNEINRLTVMDQLIKRAAKDRLPLLDAAAQAQLDDRPQVEGDPFLMLDDQIRRMREAVVFTIGRAMDRLGKQLEQDQEVSMALADACAALYGLESAVLRAKRMKEGAPRDLGMAAAQVFARDAALLIADKADYVLSPTEQREVAAADSRRVRDYVDSGSIDTFKLRRQIAAAVVDRGAYPWG